MAITLSVLNPMRAEVDGADVVLHCIGLEFTETSVILWNGAPEPTTFVSAGEVTTIVKPSTATGPNIVAVSIQDGPEGEEVVTQSLPFELYTVTVPVDPDAPIPPNVVPEPHDVYQIAGETSEPSVATGEPPQPDHPVSNLPGGGLPESPREPYPTGDPKV